MKWFHGYGVLINVGLYVLPRCVVSSHITLVPIKFCNVYVYSIRVLQQGNMHMINYRNFLQ